MPRSARDTKAVCRWRDAGRLSYADGLALQKETLMAFSLGHDREDFRFVVECMERQTIDPSLLVSGVVGFADFPAAFEGLRSAKDACKLLLKPN